LVFPEADIAALTARLTQLATDKRLREDLTARGTARVRAKYSNSSVAADFGELFQQVAKGASDSRK